MIIRYIYIYIYNIWLRITLLKKKIVFFIINFLKISNYKFLKIFILNKLQLSNNNDKYTNIWIYIFIYIYIYVNLLNVIFLL